MEIKIKWKTTFRSIKDIEREADRIIHDIGKGIVKDLSKEFKGLSPVTTGTLKKSFSYKAYRKVHKFAYYQRWYGLYAFSRKNIHQFSIVKRKIKEAMPFLGARLKMIKLTEKVK